MLDIAETGGSSGQAAGSQGGSSSRLAPLPKRVAPAGAGGSDALELPPLAYLDQLLERAFVLLSTLDKDVRDVHEDEEELKIRIEAEQAKRRSEAAKAKEQVEDLLTRAYRIAQSKTKVPILEQGLLHSVPDLDEGVTFGSLSDELEVELKAARGITGAIRLGRIGELLAQANLVVKHMQQEAEGLRERQIQYVASESQSETTEAAASFEIGTMVLARDLEILEANLPLAARQWSDPAWKTWQAGTGQVDLVRLGSYHDDRLEAEIPFLVPFPFAQSLVFETGDRRDEAISGIQSMLIRLVAGMPPGSIRFTFIDPKRLGESVAPLLPLGDLDPELIDGTVATTPEEIEERLVELTHHIERVITQHLRGTHSSLAECNASAGEIIEPYHLLVMLDHPAQLGEISARLLAAIADNGPRCGVFTIIARDAQPTYATYQTPLPERAQVFKVEPQGYGVDVANAGHWSLRLDAPPRPDGPEAPLVERIITTAGTQAGQSRESALALGKLYDLMNKAVVLHTRAPGMPDIESAIDLGDPTTWWTASSAEGLAAPLARLGPTAVAGISLDSKHPAVLVAGKPGSGVSNLLHAMLTGLIVLYPPSELELYLIGLRGNRSLGVYGTQRLPHAKVVATHADREFGLVMLREIDNELERRLAVLRDTVGERAGYDTYRDSASSPDPMSPDSTSSDPMPRIVVVIDPIEALVVPEDRTAQWMREIIENLLRLGPTAGMHLVLATRGDDMVAAAPVASLIRQRLVLDVDEQWAIQLLGDAAGQVAGLSRPGELLVCPNASDPSAARQIQAVWIDPTEQMINLRDLKRLASDHGITRFPQVYDGSEAARLERRDPMALVGDGSKQGARRMPRLWLGEPMGLGPPVEALLRRQDGANMIVVSSDPEVGQGLLLSSIVSSLLVHGDTVGVMALDFMPPEGSFTEAAHALAEGPWTVQLARRRSLVKVVDTIHRIIQDRLATDDARAKPVLFVLNGLGRARDLEVDVYGDSLPDDAHLLGTIETVVRDGPEVGVHTLAWCDSLPALNRRLPKSAQREFALRVAGPMSMEDSLAFIDSEAAANLEANQALFADEDCGKVHRLRPYVPPNVDWIERLALVVGPRA